MQRLHELREDRKGEKNVNQAEKNVLCLKAKLCSSYQRLATSQSYGVYAHTAVERFSFTFVDAVVRL